LKTATALREKSKKDPKGLWKLLNNIDKPKSDSGSNVGLDAFYEYFKNQNETPDGDDEVDQIWAYQYYLTISISP
jgi:hypothetical protein